MTRSVLDLAGTSSREIHRLVGDAVHGGSSLYALDEDALEAADARPDPDPGAVRTSARSATARSTRSPAQIDAAITVVSLEPTSIEGILNTISTVGAMTDAEDAAVELVESLRDRLGSIETKVARSAARTGHVPPRVVGLEWLDPPFAVGHWVPEQIRRAGGWDLLGQDGERSVQTDVGRGRRGRPRHAPAHAVRLPPRARPSTSGAGRRGRSSGSELDGGPARQRHRARRLGVLLAARARGSSTGSRCWPRSSIPTASSRRRRRAAGRR